jgi:hypothetical protein
MINRQAVLEYLNKHPSHTTWQMRLHFLQATREIVGGASPTENSQSSISISSIANQLNYILRDLESIGTIAPQAESLAQNQDNYHGDYSSQHSRAANKSSIS